MRNSKKWMFIGGASVVMAATGFLGYATRSDERTATQKLVDRATANLVEQQLAHSPFYNYTNVGVSSFENQVQLDGFVNTEAQKRTAEDLARETPGVAAVINHIAIKPEPFVPTDRLYQAETNSTANPPANPIPPPPPSNPAR